MTRPRRIQRRRTKGWRMPEGTVFVGRPTVWGNPFEIGKPSGVFEAPHGWNGQAETMIEALTRDQVVEFYAGLLRGFLRPEMHPHGHDWMRRFKERKWSGHPAEAVRCYLRGRDLACWCALDQDCHADVLLEIANS